MGIAMAIEPGRGVFPPVPAEEVMTLDELVAADLGAPNHASFTERHGQETAPAVELVHGYVESGFARLFREPGGCRALAWSQGVPCAAR